MKNGTPLAGAHVHLIPIMESDPNAARGSAMTGPGGAFHAEVPWTGEYYLGVSLGVLTCAGRVQPPLWRRGNVLGFAKGEQKTGLVFELEQGAVLQGVVKDERGKPVAKAYVSLTKRVRTGEKTYRWVEVGSVQSDEQANYGFCSLPEGLYFVNVQGSMRTFDSKYVTDLLPRDYVRTYYPAGKTAESSRSVRIADGEVTQLELTLHDAPTRRVKGHVVIPPNPKFSEPFVVLQHLQPTDSTVLGYHAPVDKDGNFEFAGVAQGRYKAVAMVDSGEREERTEPIVAQINKEWTASTEIDVAETDVTITALTPTPRARISAQFWNEHGELIKDSRLFLTLLTEDGRTSWRTADDGRRIPPDIEMNSEQGFVFHELEPGHYRFGPVGRLTILRPALGDKAIYVTAATHDGQDLLKDGFDLRPGDSLNNVAIVIGSDSGNVKGTVFDQAGHSIQNALVFIVPSGAESKQWHRYRSICSRPHGAFEISGIAPGDYQIFAFQSPPVTHYVPPWSCGAMEQLRPEDAKFYEKRGQAIHIAPLSTLELNLKLIPAE